MIRALIILAVGLGGCTQYTLTREQILDPAECQGCHPIHYEQWSGSMHAYAAEDPVFLAMNRLGQDATDGELGDFCVSCHAPLAVREGLTEDGLDLAAVDPALRGVTCAFCHLTEEVVDDHNAALVLADDLVMRGALEEPLENSAHASAYSSLMDRNDLESASACGSCHDIVTPAGVELERTFQEWRGSIFNQTGLARLTCGSCHMRGGTDLAAVFPDAVERTIHDHRMPGVDVALEPFPQAADQAEQVQLELDRTVKVNVCVGPVPGGAEITVRLENITAGHSFPSGAAQDRRLWTEVRAYSGDEVLFETGVVPDGVAAAEHLASDPGMWLLRDRLLDAEGNEVHMFWEAASVESELLTASVTADPTDPRYFHFEERTWTVLGTVPDRVTTRLRLRPMGLEVIDQLIAAGELEAEVRDAFPVFDLATGTLEWTGPVGSCEPAL